MTKTAKFWFNLGREMEKQSLAGLGGLASIIATANSGRGKNRTDKPTFGKYLVPAIGAETGSTAGAMGGGVLAGTLHHALAGHVPGKVGEGTALLSLLLGAIGGGVAGGVAGHKLGKKIVK